MFPNDDVLLYPNFDNTLFHSLELVTYCGCNQYIQREIHDKFIDKFVEFSKTNFEDKNYTIYISWYDKQPFFKTIDI